MSVIGNLPDIRNMKPAAYPITDMDIYYDILPSVRYRIRGWFRITDVRYTNPATYPIMDMSVIGYAAGFILQISGTRIHPGFL